MGDSIWNGLDREQFNHPLLDAREEQDLLARIAAGDARAVEKLVQCNQRMVLDLALRYLYSGMAGDLTLAEVIGAGNEGLMSGIRKWDLTKGKGLRASTYLMWWVKASMRRHCLTKGKALARTVREADLEYKIRRSIARLYQQFRREPTQQEISDDTGISLFLVGEIMPFIQASVFSFDRPQDDDDDLLDDRLPSSERDPADEVEEKLAKTELRAALKELPPKWAEVIKLRYFVEPAVTYTDIGRMLGVSKTRIQEIERLAIKKLKSVLGGESEE